MLKSWAREAARRWWPAVVVGAGALAALASWLVAEEPAAAPVAEPAPAAEPVAPAAPAPVVAPPVAVAPRIAAQRMLRARAGVFNVLRDDNLPDPPPRYNLTADPDDAEQDRVNNRMVADQLLEEGRSHSTNRLRSDEPRDAIDAALSLLEYSRRQPASPVSRIDCFERLLSLAWERRPKESTEQMVQRLTTHPLVEALQNPLEDQFDYRDNYLAQLAPRYEEAAGNAWPLDWRGNEKFWAALLVRVVEAKTAADPAAYWKQLIEKDVEGAEWHRPAYVAALRQSPGKLDLNLLRPWLDSRPEADPVQIRLIGELVKTAAVLAPDEEDALRIELRKRFLAELARLPASEKSFDERVGVVLAELYQADLREGRDAIEQILAHESPWPFFRLMPHLSMDGPAAQRMMQGRRVKVAFRQTPLAQAIKELEAKVVLSLWIDDEVRGSAVPVTLEREGPWLEVLDAALEPTNFRAVFLPYHVLWIGPRDKAAAARAFFGDALARLQSAGNMSYQFASNDPFAGPAGSGGEVTAFAFDKTPLADVLAAINEKMSPAIECPEELVRKAKVTLQCRDLPLPLVVALVARSIGAEWDVVGTSIVVGTPKKMAELRELVQRHERRMATLAARTDRVSKALREASGTSVSDTSLADLLSFMQQSHEIGVGYFAAAGGPSPEKPMSMESRESWAWDLDVVSFQLGLGWDYSPEGVWLAGPARLERIRELAAARAKEPPADEARQTLASAVTLKIAGKLLADIKASDDDGETLGVTLDFSRLSPDLRKKKFHGAFVELPLAIVLDLIAAECDARWELAGETVRFVPRTP